MKRVPMVELLDSDAGTRAEVVASLADLRWFNRWFGGITTTQSLVEHVARRTASSQLSLLEVASGAGYVPQSIRERLKPRGLDLQVTLMDRVRSHLDSFPRAVGGDALALPFRDASFDVVSCCLFAHHLMPDELVRFVNESLRVCRKAVLINDLVRHPALLAVVYAGLPLYRSRLTRHDAPASVRQAYTPQEMREMLGKTPATRVEMTRHYLGRMGVVAWKAG